MNDVEKTLKRVCADALVEWGKKYAGSCDYTNRTNLLFDFGGKTYEIEIKERQDNRP